MKLIYVALFVVDVYTNSIIYSLSERRGKIPESSVSCSASVVNGITEAIVRLPWRSWWCLHPSEGTVPSCLVCKSTKENTIIINIFKLLGSYMFRQQMCPHQGACLHYFAKLHSYNCSSSRAAIVQITYVVECIPETNRAVSARQLKSQNAITRNLSVPLLDSKCISSLSST